MDPDPGEGRHGRARSAALRSLALAALLRSALTEMELSWPGPDFDVEEQRGRLLAD